MKFEINAFLPSQEQILKDLGLDKGGRVQSVVDSEFIRYMRDKMPTGQEKHGFIIDGKFSLQNSIRHPEGGIITVETPYAHYQNEGELYLAANGSSWAKKYEPKYPSGRHLKTYLGPDGGPGRGSHFVERTASENFNDILRAAQKELDRRLL